VRGLELTTGQPIWVPAVMAAYRISTISDAERFTYRISTGFSIHTDPVEAVVGGICEIIERDAVALTWLQRLPLPRLDRQVRSATLEDLMAWGDQHFVQIHLFDATTDLGVPTVYALYVAAHDQRANHIVASATARNLTTAAEKACIEALVLRNLYHSDEPIPGDFADFTAIDHGARYMGDTARAEAFAFLTDDTDERPIAPCPSTDLAEAPDDALAQLIEIFAAREMPVAVVDRTPPDLLDAGLTCVSVVIPDLQPMSLLPLAQFKGHQRLYQGPARMGYRVLPEEELNPWPQPFA
jgi:ribosomal protein S12 methylthiotransferase accessory factor